jgi:hypothetical protein
MSHIVIHDDSTNGAQYAQFDDLQAAAGYLEELHNAETASSPRLYALEEVQFAVKSYVKVEIGEAVPMEASAIDAPFAETVSLETLDVDTPEQMLAEAPPVFTDEMPITDPFAVDAAGIDTVEYVEAAMAPVDAFAPTPPSAAEPADAEPRRGLFGR